MKKMTNSGWLTFQLPNGVMRGRIGICCSRSRECSAETFTAAGAEFRVAGKVVPKSRIKPWEDANGEKCILLQDKWMSYASRRRKQLVYVAMRFKTIVEDVGISHVIAM